MINLDNGSYIAISRVLLHDYSYPIKNIKEKSSYNSDEYKTLSNKYDHNHENFIENEDLNKIINGIELMLRELNDNDFANLIELRKPQAKKLVEILRKAERGEITTINSHMWLINREDWQ
jgi:O6-methylguanine-DNA--protein-cysteine methyltransferase